MKCKLHIIPPNDFISGRANSFIKASHKWQFIKAS